MAVNHVAFNGNTLIDLRPTTITPETVLKGFGGFGNDGIWISGRLNAGIEYESGEVILQSDSSHPIISFSRQHNETPILAVIADADGSVSNTTQTVWSGVYFDFYKAFGEPIAINDSEPKFGSWYYTYKGSYSSGLATSAILFDYGYDNPSSSNYRYSRFYCTESEFKPYSNSATRYFKRDRLYKWYAIWR